jgi:hypothetical protein
MKVFIGIIAVVIMILCVSAISQNNVIEDQQKRIEELTAVQQSATNQFSAIEELGKTLSTHQGEVKQFVTMSLARDSFFFGALKEEMGRRDFDSYLKSWTVQQEAAAPLRQ